MSRSDAGQPPLARSAGVRIEAEQTFGGVTIASTMRAGWWWGTERQDEGEFFRARITGAAFG